MRDEMSTWETIKEVSYEFTSKSLFSIIFGSFFKNRRKMSDNDEEAIMKKYEDKEIVIPKTLKKGVDLHK